MPYSSSIQIVNDANGTAYAFLADNGNLFQGQWNAEAQRWDQGRIVPGAFGARDLQVLVVDDLWPSSGTSGAVPGNAPGIVLAYRIGNGASSQVVASLGAWGTDGSLSWSEPVVVSSGQGEDEAFGLGQGQNPGTVQLVLQKREPSSSPQELLAQFRSAPQEVINQKLDALATGARTDSDLYLSTLTIVATGQDGYSLQQSANGANGNKTSTALTPESDQQPTAPPAAPSGGNTLLSRAALAANAAPTPAAAPTLLGSNDPLGAAAPASPGVSFATAGSTSSQGGGFSVPFFNKSGFSAFNIPSAVLYPYRYQLSSGLSREKGLGVQSDNDLFESVAGDPGLEAEGSSELDGSLRQSQLSEDFRSSDSFSKSALFDVNQNPLLDSAIKLEKADPLQNPPADQVTPSISPNSDPFAGKDWELVFKGLFGGLLAGQGGYTVANFSTLSFGKDARSSVSLTADQAYDPKNFKGTGYTSGLKVGAAAAGSLKTIYQYSSHQSGSSFNLLSFTAKESLGADISLYRAKIYDTGARLIINGSVDFYGLLEQRYASETDIGLPDWLKAIGLTTGAAGDALSFATTVRGFGGSVVAKRRKLSAPTTSNIFSENGLGIYGASGNPDTTDRRIQNSANAIGLTSAILSIGTVAGAASSDFNQYGTASWGFGSQQAVRVRALSKYGVGLEVLAGVQENTLWDFSGNQPVPDEQILAFGSAGVSLAFGGYIPILNASWKWNSKPSTTTSTEPSLAAASSLTAASTTSQNPSGSYVQAPTGSSYPMSYAPASATDALYTTPGGPLASLTSTPTPLYLYQLSAFVAANLSTGALDWKNNGAGYLNDGDYTSVPLIGLSLPGSATATASFTVTGGSIVPASFSVQLPPAQPGQGASGQYLALPQATSGNYSFGVDVFQQVAGNPAPPLATGASSVHTAMPLFNIDIGNTSVLAISAIARIPQQISLEGFQQSASYLPTQASASTSSKDSKLTSYANVAVVLNGTAVAQGPQQTITTLNPGTATVNLVNGQLISIILDQPLYFANPAQTANSCSLVLDLATALDNPSIVNPSLSVTPQLQGLADFTDQDSFTANPTANNAGVYLSAGLIDTLPLLSSYGHWPVQNRVTYVEGANTVYLNNTPDSNGKWSAVTPSDLTLSKLNKNPDQYQFSAASEPTSITDSSSNTTYVFWVEASDSVVPLSGSDGEANYQAFMNALYGNQRINYSYATTSPAGTNTKWWPISPADLYSSPGNVITNLRAFSVQVEVNGAPQTRSLLVWSELPISAIQNAENGANAGSPLPDSPQAKLYAGFINPNAANTPGGYQWKQLFNDSNGNSTIKEIPWTSDSGSGLSIADLSAASQLIQVPSGTSGATDTVLTPVLSWSQAVRTPYNEAVLASQPALFLPLGSLQSGSNAINIGSANVNTETFASSTGLNTAIAGALPKSTASAVQNVQGLGVLATGLGSTNKPILDLLRNIPQADRNSAQSDPVAIFSGTIDATTLTVSSLSQGTLEVGELLVGAGVAAGTTITSTITAATATTAGVYTLSTASSVATTTTLRTLPKPNPYSYSSFNGSFSGTGGSNGYTTLTVSGLSGSLQIGDRVLGLGLPGGSFVAQVQSFDASTGSGVYTLNQGPASAGGSYGLAALPGGSSSPYSIEFWTQLAPGSNPAGAGLVNLGQASAAALPDRPAATPEGWLLSSSFVVEQLTWQDALKLGLETSLGSNTANDLYGWRWALVADGANTTAMGGNGGANLNRNALVLDNLVVGDRIEGVNTFLANYGLTSSDLLGIDGTPADQIAAVPTTQLQFSTDLTFNAAVQAAVAETTLNGVAIDTSSAVMNGGIVTNGAASGALATMFDQLSTFELKTGQAKVNFSLNPNTQTNPPAPSTPSSTQLETYGGLALQFALLPGPAVSVNGSGQIAFDVAPGQTLLSTDGTDLRNGDWRYVVVSFLPDYVTYSADGSLVDVASNVGTASLYIDGKQVASVANVVNPYAPSNVNDYAQLLSDNAQGSIDLVALYDKALTTLSEPQSVSSWPLPTGQDALALMKEAGFVVASKTPNPGAIPGAVSNHWLAHTVNPNNALNSTYTTTLIPDGDGGGTWSQATALNPVAAPQATIPSASTPAAQQDLLIAINPSDWSKAGWFSSTATTAAAFNPAGNDLKAITVQLTPSSTGDSVVRTLTPEQVLLGTKAQTSLAELQPLAEDQDFNYTFLSNTPALNLLISRQPNANDSGDSKSLDPKLSYTASVTLTFEDGSTVSNTPSGSSSSSSGTGLALGFSSSLASELKATSSTSRNVLATAAVVEEAPLQLKYVDSGEVFSSQSTTADSPASTFGMSQAAGYSANSNGTTQNGWLAIAQPRSTNAKSDPAGRVWINYTGQFTVDATTNQRTASTDAANAPSTWLNALASSNFNPQAPNLPLLNNALYQSSVGGLLIKADPSAGWGQNFGANMLVADVNNDGTQDLIISAPQANGGGAVVIVDGEWIAINLTASTGETILDLSNPSNLGSHVTVLTPGTVNTTGTDITTAAGFGTALAFDTTTNTLWIGAPNYLRTLDSSTTPNASTQPIGALYSYSTSANPNSWDSGKATSLGGAILGSGGTLTTTQAGNTSSTSYWGAQFGTAVAVASSGELAVSAPGVVGSMLYTGTEAANQIYLQGNRNYKADVPDGVLNSIQLGGAIDATGGTTSPLLIPISSLSAKNLTSQQKAFLTQLKDQAVTQVAPATTQNNQALQSGAVGAVVMFQPGTNYTGLANSAITPEAIAGLNGTTFIGANPINTQGDSGFGSSLSFADLTNTNSQQLIVGASSSNGGGLVYTIDPSAPGTDTSLGSNQYLAILAATNVFTAAEAFDGLGNGLVSLGDVNNDGYDDVLLQAYNASSGAGNAYVLFGSDQLATAASNAGLASLASGSIGTIAYKQGSSGTIAILSELGSAGALAGQGNYGAGDINADGYNDILLGSGALANAYLTWGHPYLESITDLQLSKLASNTGFLLDGLATSNQGSLRSVGDFNGDGYGDFISINPGNALTTVRIELGANTQEILADAAYSYYTFTVANGTEVLPGGDINGDGIDDIVLFLDQNLSSAADGNQGAGSTTGILYGRSSADLPLGSGFGFIARVDPSTSAPLASLPGLAVEKAGGEVGLTDATPSVIAVGDTLYAAVKGKGDTTLWITQSSDGGNSWDNWSELTTVNAGFSTSTGPSLAYFNDTLYLSFVNSAGTLSLSSWDPTSSNLLAWSTPTALSGSTAAATAFSSSTAPQLVDRGNSLGVLWVENGVVYASSTTEPGKANTWTNPLQLEVLQGGSATAIAASDAPSFTWLGTTPVLAVNEGGTIQIYAGQGGGATLQLASSFFAPAGLSIVSAPVLTTTDTGLAITYTNSDGSISLQRLNLVSSTGAPLPGVQFTSGGGIDVSQADLNWQNTILTESNSGISSSLASTPVSVNGNLLLTNIRNTTSQDSQIWINAVPNASDPDSTTWLNSTIQLPDGSGGSILSQRTGADNLIGGLTPGAWQDVANGAALSAPSLTRNGDTVYMAVQGTDNHLYWNSSGDNGQTWNSWQILPTGMGTYTAPSIAYFNNTLYLCYVAAGSNDLNVTYLDGNNWKTQYQISGQTATAAAMVVEGSNLAVYFVSEDATDRILKSYSSQPSSGSTWTNTSVEYDGGSSQTASSNLALTRYNGQTYIAYQGGTSGTPSNTIYLTTASDSVANGSSPVWTLLDTPTGIDPVLQRGVGLTSGSQGLVLTYTDTNQPNEVAVQLSNADVTDWAALENSIGLSSSMGYTPLITADTQNPLLIAGNASNDAINVQLNGLNAQILNSAQTGSTISAIGDINVDGFDDLAITANNVAYSPSGNFGSSDAQLTTGVRIVLGAATATAFSSANDATADQQTVQIAGLYPQPSSSQAASAVTPVANLSGPTTLNLNGALGGSSYQISSTAGSASGAGLSNADVTATGNNPASLQQLFAGASATSTMIPTWDSALVTGSPSLQTLAAYGDLNADGYVDYLAPDGLQNVYSSDGAIAYGVWSIRAAGDVNGNGVDDVLLSLAPQGPAYQELTSGQPSALMSVLVDGSLFAVVNNQFSLDRAEGTPTTGWSSAGLKTPLNPYSRNQLYDVASTSTSAYLPSLQNWFDPILSFTPGSLTAASTANGFNPDTAESYTAPAVAISPEGESYLVFSGYDNKSSGSGLWMAYQQADGSWTQTNLPKGSDASFLSPSAVFYEGKLTIAYTDVNGDLNIAWCGGNPQDSSATWSSYQVVTGGTTDESSQWNPTLVVEAGRLALYFPSNAGNTQTQTIRYLYSIDPFNANANSNSNGNWGSSWRSTGNGYSGVSGTITVGTNQPTVTSPIAATTFQGRTVLAFRSSASNLDNGHILLLTQVASAPTSSDPSTSLSWVQTDTGQTGSNGVGLTTDQALLYLTSTTFPSVNFSNPSPKIWSLAPGADDDGTWTLGTQESVSGPGFAASFYAGYNPLSESSYGSGSGNHAIQLPTVLTPFMLNGKLMATWSGGYGSNAGKAFSVQLADLNATITAPRQVSLAGYSIDGNIDINGDGFKDMLVSDPSDPAKSVNNQYALFGGDYLNIASQVGTAGNDTLIGTPLADVIYTIGGSDRVISNGGADVIYTGSGDDQISITGNAFTRIDAGSGFDVLQLEGLANQSYDFRLNVSAPEYFAGTKLRDIELITSRDFGANTLYFDPEAINAINPDRILFLTPDASDTINLTGEFQRNSSFDTSYGGGLWYAYAAGGGSGGTTNPTLAYVRVPDGSNAVTWLASRVNVGAQSTVPLAASFSAAMADPVPTIPSPSPVAGSSNFGNGLTITAYRTNPNSGAARFKISRSGNFNSSQLVSYVSSSQNSAADPGRHYTSVAGLLRLEVGQAEADINVPIDAVAIAALRNGTLSLEVAELDDWGQKEFHLLLDLDPTTAGLRPVLSGLNLQVDPSSQTASIGFRADMNKDAGAVGLASTLNLNVLRRQSATNFASDPETRIQKLVISEGEIRKFDLDSRTNGQVSLQLDLNAITGSIQLLANSGLQPLVLSKLDPTRKPITVGVDLTTMSLDSLTLQTPPSGVVLNQTAIDFTVAADRHGRAKVFMDLTQTGGDLDLTEVINGVVIRKPNIYNLYYGIDDGGTLSALTYNARHRAGARFYDTDGNGIAEFVSLTFVDGGLGDKGPRGDGIIDDPSTAGVVKLTDVMLTTPDQHTLMAASASNAAAPASLVLRASLSRRAATVNHIGYVVLDATNETDTFESIFADLTSLKQRSQTLFSTLESTDITLAPGTALSREILLINGQSVRFFEVQNGTLDQLSSANDSRLRILKADPNFARNGLFSSSSGVGLSLSLVDGDQGLNALVGQEQGLAPVLDLTAFTADQPLVATLSLAREAAFDAVTGFYRSLDIQGTVWRDPSDVTKGTITPGEIGYSAAALKNMVDSLTGLQVGNRQTNTRSITLQESTYLAPIAQVNGNTFVAFASGNADGIAHFVTLGTNTFGLEDKFGGGDLDYDDQVISFNFKPVSGLVAA